MKIKKEKKVIRWLLVTKILLVEKIFLVSLRDVLVPVVETGGVSTGGSASATDDSLVLEGRILVAGGGAGVTDRGILFSSKPNPSYKTQPYLPNPTRAT